MEVVQYIHRLNMTEAGLSGTKALFLRVSTDAVPMLVKFWGISNLSLDTNYPIVFNDQQSSKKYTLVLRKFSKNSKELRINSIVDYLRDKNIETGDEITFTRISKNPGHYEYYISMKKNDSAQFCYVRPKKLYVILNRELLSSQSDRGRLIVTHNGKDIELSYEFVENNTLRDAATTIVGDSTAKALSFDLYEVKLGNNSPKVNMSLKKSGDKYIVIEEKRWEFHGLNN